MNDTCSTNLGTKEESWETIKLNNLKFANLTIFYII